MSILLQAMFHLANMLSHNLSIPGVIRTTCHWHFFNQGNLFARLTCNMRINPS